MSQTAYPLRPVLLVDDEPHTLASFDIALRSAGISNTLRCQDSRTVSGLLAEQKVAVILLDLMMPHVSGQEILAHVVQEYPGVPVIVITGVNEVETAVECMREGAFDYVLKPVDTDRLLLAVRRALEVGELRRENVKLSERFLSDSLERPEVFRSILTRSPKIRAIFQYCEAVAEGQQPVLITGETGVGKEVIARVLHELSGRTGTFVAVNVAGLDDHVFTDTLFGHTRGAFTGADRARSGLVEKAAGGTLFLDEIGDLSAVSQVKLLRFLEGNGYYPLGADSPKSSTARVLVATHKDIESMLERGEFRQDLYYRLRTHRVHLPPLRERKEDIPLLFEHFLKEAADEFGKPKPAYPKELLTLLTGYHFPGNIRELRAMVFDAVSSHGARMLSTSSFKGSIGQANHAPVPDVVRPEPQTNETWLGALEPLPTLKEASRMLIEEALRRSDGNQRVAAFMLGISPQALNQRLKRK